MLTLDDPNLSIDFLPINEKLKKIREMAMPPFVGHTPDISWLKEKAEEYSHYNNFIIIGNGGSVNNSRAFYGSLYTEKNLCFVTTMEPGFLGKVSEKYTKKDTLVIAISKSGTTIGVLESLMFFINKNYNVVGITQNSGTLYDICQKKGYDVIEHPEVGGRYSARTSCALFPAALLGIDLEKLETGFRSAYEKFSPAKNIEQNPALRLAAELYLLEKAGKVDVFMPVYSSQLSAFLPIIIQLMHESFGKNGQGQSYFGDLAPESQHHTNQRFFGGRDNICGVFMKCLMEENMAINVAEELKDIDIKGNKLQVLDKIPYSKSLQFEFEGTYQDAIENNIPVACVSLQNNSEESIGEFMGFWQYVAVYASILRGVNPYDQPQVESSKRLSFEKRQNFEQ